MRRALFLTALVLLPTLPAFAHDYWLEPESFFVAASDTVAVRMHVGEALKSEAERPFQKKPTLKFQLFSAKETLDLLPFGKEDKTPVVTLTPKAAGTYLIAMERDAQFIKLDAKKFNDYLAEEGLDAVLEQRRKAGEDKAEGRERYRRYLKSIIQAGDKPDDTYKKVLGQKLEIVPQSNPAALKAGDSLVVQVLFDGKPLAGARLSAHVRSDGKVETQKVVTSKEGTATVKIDRAGTWLLRLVHMRRAADDKEADWESFWASCSFGVKE
jgi:uncharacterized GH25 family protein